MKIIYPVILACLPLSGCQVQRTPPSSVKTQTISADTRQIYNTEQQHHLQDIINQRAGSQMATFTANSDRLSLDWEGDAIELLAQLARQRGLSFGYTGVRLPLPVSVHVSNITFENLLYQLTVQTSWRATLKQYPLELHLYFALPEKGDRIT